MAFDLGSVTARIDADISGFKKGLGDAQDGIQTFSKKVDHIGDNITNFGKKVSVVSAAVGVGLTMFLKDASQEAINFERAMITLDIIAGRFGVSGTDAKNAAEALGKELRIGVGPAAESIQNLLKSGLNLDQARELLKRFTNEAITGKSPTITLSQAVQNLSFAYATGNSALGNLSGISENFVNIIEKGREALIAEGMAASEVTDEMAKFRGMMDLTNLTLGSSERFHGTIIDKQAQLDQQVVELKKSFGELINPVLADLIGIISNVVSWITSLSEEQKKAIVIIGLVVTAIGPLLIILGTLVSGISAVITIIHALGVGMAFLAANPIVLLIAAIVLLAVLIVKNWDQIKAAFELGRIYISDAMNKIADFLSAIGGKIKDILIRPFSEAFDRIKDIVNNIKDKLDFTKRQSPSVVDIVTRGVDRVNSALMGLDAGLNMTPNIAGAVSHSQTSGASINNIRVDMSGAIVADQYSAQRMGETIGDNIIKKLQLNVRF